MQHQRTCAGELFDSSESIVDIGDDADQLESLTTPPVEGAPEVEFPVVNPGRCKLALLGHRMHDEECAHPESTCGAGQVMNIEAGDCRGDNAAVSIDHRVVNERKKEISHCEDLRDKSGRRRAVRFSASARRHSRTLPWSPLSSTSGTRMPRNSSGRVYCGYSSVPAANDSSVSESELPSTPGISLPTASTTTIAGSSPPLNT